MERPNAEENAQNSQELDALMQQMMEAQAALGENVASTSQFLRFALSMANENLGVIRTQLETIRDLAKELEEGA